MPLFVLVLLSHLAGVGYWLWDNYRKLHTPKIQKERIIKIRPGAGLSEVLTELERLKILPNPLFTRLYLRVAFPDLVLKRGTYEIPERASGWDVLNLIHQGHVLQKAVTLPEGLDKWETAALLGTTDWGDEAAFLALINNPEPIRDLDPNATDLEGYLFPETYYFEESATPKDIISHMITLFRKRTKAYKNDLDQSGLSLRQWVTLASLIEKETAINSERFAISGVFHRRLERHMLLQCDPTIIYALKLDNQYRGKIYQSQIKYPHPYNTYVYSGLPPGPIASPSLSCLAAALKPESHDYLYFVAKNDGSHHFSKTLAEHNRAVQKYRR
ncbi:MAG: endolytic transglycosylase MltG [Acidobacteria bacterium]|nr:endolytic transglycosylase MltG [Acidobacteriota bacterium]